MRVFNFTWQVCQALELPQAVDLLAAAAGIMQEYLDDYPDLNSQAAYLAQPHYQALWQIWQEQQDPKSPRSATTIKQA